MITHYAVVRCSGRIVPVERIGKLLIVYHNRRSISTCRYDERFILLPKEQ